MAVPEDWASLSGNFNRISYRGGSYQEANKIFVPEDIYIIAMLRTKVLLFAKDRGMIIVPERTPYANLSMLGARFDPVEAFRKVQLPPVVARVPKQERYDRYQESPYFPVLLKGAYGHIGKDKYPIEGPEQLALVNNFFYRKYPIDCDPENYCWSIRQHLAASFYTQELIETPSDRYTSYRVLVTPEGEILASELFYSEPKDSMPTMQKEGKYVEAGSSLLEYFEMVESPFYLAAKNVFSNRSQGGNGIVLDGNKYSRPPNEVEKKILTAHGLDASQPRLASEIREKSQAAAHELAATTDLVVGIDWIQQADTGKFYFLEVNPGPGHKALQDTYKGLLADKTEEQLDIIMRTAALYLFGEEMKSPVEAIIAALTMVGLWEKEVTEIIDSSENLQDVQDEILRTIYS